MMHGKFVCHDNSAMQRISTSLSQPLYSIAATRQIEQQAAAALPPHTLMQRAGLAVARLALALAPHARHIWIACGPGNNGGDGFEAALHLHRWGKRVTVTWTGLAAGKTTLPPDAQASRERAQAAGVPMTDEPPPDFDLCIDALLGIGATLDPSRPGTALMQQWLTLMQASAALSLAVDVPSGLDADTGVMTGQDLSSSSRLHTSRTQRIFTLSLLTLKPGLFTASGRDHAGQVWFDDLDLDPLSLAAPQLPLPCAWLLGTECNRLPDRAQASHASHKGSFGDVAVVGGESSRTSHMSGAALLSASAALHSGAGRVFVSLLGDAPGLSVDTQQPELMFCAFEALDFNHQVVVCGCGGGQAVRAVLPALLASAVRLVLDADALNAIAAEPPLQAQLKARHLRGFSTVLTPHPLEAARLLATTAAAVQAERFSAARQLADRFACVVVLKGSGTLIAAPMQSTCVNASGNAVLATAGTGDVLAGMIGASLASGLKAFEAACSAVSAHGLRADLWAAERPGQALTASALARQQDGASPDLG